jgi:glycosyltransferase involved in cell wall biosynthesis
VSIGQLSLSEPQASIEMGNGIASMSTHSPPTTPQVSIVIPCYKQAHFLPEAIESVLAQSEPRFEVLVVDDGSPDETAEVAARFAARDPRVRCLRRKNGGLSRARNLGIEQSRGRFLVFLDADDILRPNCLAAGLACFAERPAAMMVWGRYGVIRENGEQANPGSKLFEGEDLYHGLLRINCIGMVSSVMYRREIFDAVGGFDPAISPAADYDLYLRIARQHPSHRHGEVVSDYRVYETSMSHNHAVMLRAVIIGLRRNWRYVRGNADYEAAYHEGKQVWWDYYGEPLYLQTLRRLWTPREWRRVLRGLWYLALYYPECILLHGRSRWNKLVTRIFS